MPWATPDQALTYTGQELTAEELAPADAMITVYCGRTGDEPVESISARDRRWLAMATAYQAAWMKGKPGLLEYRESHTSSSADGVSVQRESDSQIMLAPMAARCLRNLSWIGNTTTYQGPPVRTKGSFISERGDDYHGWSAVGIT